MTASDQEDIGRPVASYLAPVPSGAMGVDLPVPRRALAIGAHPDDIDFGCGGTLAKWAAAGCTVAELVLTDGSKGSWDPTADRAELVALRREEQRAAAATLGAESVVFLDHVDGELTSGLSERAEVCRVIREVRPDVVLGHDPWRRYRLHPDHRHAGFLAVEGIVAARDPHFFPEQGLAPHRPAGLLLWEADEVDHVEGIEGFLDTKLAALLAHRSQWVSTMGIDADRTAEEEAFEIRIRQRAAEAGAAAGLPIGEAFKRIDRL
ncbi:MAG TPA: PIG-L family deacetylase [Acidimicrobiia bacterium]|jgi:LmbE family N-acetylglucosaminyl deacetylase|nr:PIG-L family deacetylase [Acidimicrobiia bacterium]